MSESWHESSQQTPFTLRTAARFAVAVILLISGSVAAQTAGQDLNRQYRQTYDFISMKDTIFTFESEFILPDGYHYTDSSELTPYQNWIAHIPIWHRYKPVGHWKLERQEDVRGGRGVSSYPYPMDRAAVHGSQLPPEDIG